MKAADLLENQLDEVALAESRDQVLTLASNSNVFPP